jgi:hypothetical protein
MARCSSACTAKLSGPESPFRTLLSRPTKRIRSGGTWLTDKDFRTLVRLAKKWRNHAELKPLKSFAIELIMAHVLDKEGSGGTVEQRFRRFLLYIAQSGLKDVISFPENTLPHGSFSDPVVVLDPVYSLNNVTSRITETERKAIVAAAVDAWETANFASAENDNEVWKELFGPRFKVQE